ncbi:MAG TPA: type II toxin-antitoxin system prevent-host-death family antitoxin [Aromatoleum sp.]|uniref:type II toxin-antitoxin system Phd/YefM family antitoxin n=1 Tax=Aromatoleum sp. TaxID=2307007 RepID=UPI002B4A3A2F|nr:type II toxin-antitoxin system prevent-host-death family antitoxin [Aromatoleum sp.]HJV24403.1 type II toxin-antitoxin system prevent-host-death family antitoxin [Aromatoleum sp.]
MKTVPVYEAKNRFSELLAAVEQGEVVSITRRGVPVARLVAESGEMAGAVGRRKRVADALASLRHIRTSLKLEGDLKAIARDGLD